MCHSLFAADETKDSSSDWSTSEDEEDEGNGFNPLRPSTHSTLQAQWEWRAMGAETSHSDKWVIILPLALYTAQLSKLRIQNSVLILSGPTFFVLYCFSCMFLLL